MIKLTNTSKFLDDLPELVDSSLMLKFVIFMTGNYRPLISQCLSNTINLSQTTLGCVLQYRGHVSSSGQATGGQSKIGHQRHGSRDKSRTVHAPSGGGGGGGGGKYKAFARALSWEKSARIYHRLVVGLYLYHLGKNIVIDSIGYDLTSSSVARDFRFLDCLLMGRFRFVGRTNKISAEIANVFLFAFLVYRTAIHVRVPKFKFYALEFLMSSHAEVLNEEFKTNVTRRESSSYHGRLQLLRRPQTGCATFGHHHNQHHHQAAVVNQEHEASGSTSKRLGINSIYYLRSPFDPQESKWILRLNRTSKSWLTLNLCTKLLIYWTIFVFIVWFALLYRTLAGSILTNTGFEMSYPACVSWLRDTQRANHTDEVRNNNYSDIYLAPQVLPHEIRIDDLPARIPLDTGDLPRANLYNFARIFFDLIENHLLYMEFILIFVAQFYLLAICSIDVVVNALAIKARLVSLLDKLETQWRLAHEHKTRTLCCYSKFLESHGRFDTDDSDQWQPTVAHTSMPPSAHPVEQFLPTNTITWPTYNWQVDGLNAGEHGEQLDDKLDEHLVDEIADLQAILADHFGTITRGYNTFIAFFANFLLLIWLSYTIVICTWIGAVKSRAIEWEFVIAESGGTLFALILLSGAAFMRSQNIQLYPLIARAMALDANSSPTKTRWTIILKYFHPKPFFCFTILGSTELSLLLCLKLLSWIVSAFILLANFYYTNRV